MQSAHIKSVHFSPHFLRAFQKLPRAVQDQAKKKDEWFRQNPFDRRLRTHKLKGELTGAWAYSINRNYRVLFVFSMVMK
jgi:mRNA-degrading endonuclease RelE of RelBE toxin-antitoxin system